MSSSPQQTPPSGKGKAGKPSKNQPSEARPSSSVLLISPTNQILLLHRVRTSSSFPAAHVFPGGAVDSIHDGRVPSPDEPDRHEDGPSYRMAAIRETFEESGILLARNNGFGRLIELNQAEREDGRRKVHNGEVEFGRWLAGKGGRADVDGLIPFTRWITPTQVPKRFTTQMYIYFLPVSSSNTTGHHRDNQGSGGSVPAPEDLDAGHEAVIPDPTSDGGVEHTTARFLPPSAWIEMQNSGEIILFPPQLFLLSLVAQFLSSAPPRQQDSTEDLTAQRQRLRDFLKTGVPPWGAKCISPITLLTRRADGRIVLSLEKPGQELERTDRAGERDRVVLVDFRKEGPRKVEVAWRRDVLKGEREVGSAKLS